MALNNSINTAGLGAGFVYSDGLGGLSIGTPSGGGSIKVTKFTSSGIWTKDADCQSVTVICWNGGSGGGSGRQGATTAAGGGGGGTNGAVLIMGALASMFNTTETVTIGAGGAGGVTQGSTSSNGNPGTTGGVSSLGSIFALNPNSGIGGGGGGGTATTSAFNNYGQLWNLLYSTGVNLLPNNGTLVLGSNGAPANQTALSLNNGAIATNALYLSTMGGPASGADSSVARQAGNAAGIAAMGDSSGLVFTSAGGAGGIDGGTINGGPGNNAITNTGGRYIGATGGGGGGGQSGGASAGIGGAGGIPGGGGGGGGGSLNGTTSGAGGAGGRGELWVIEYLS